MYKVFINDSSLELFPKGSESSEGIAPSSPKEWLKLVKMLENSEEPLHYRLDCDDVESCWEQFKSLYTFIEAAGGVVKNTEGKVLMIYRLEKWDLPKGKLEDGENPQEGGKREVEEECGVGNLEIRAELPSTYHTYLLKGQRILKRTYWYQMFTDDNSDLVPQHEEDINRAEWVAEEDLPQRVQDTYASIRWMMKQAGF